MNELYLSVNGFERNVVSTMTYFNGLEVVFRFDNKYGALVVNHDYSKGHEQGLWELAVIKFEIDDYGFECWNVTYDTPITDDVIGYLTNDQVLDLLKQIEEL